MKLRVVFVLLISLIIVFSACLTAHADTPWITDFTATNENPIAGEQVTFTATVEHSDGPVVYGFCHDFMHNVGYDQYGSSNVFNWTFATPGVYFTTVETFHDDDYDMALIVVTVGDTPGNHFPTVDAGGPYSGNVGEPVSLSATGDDPDGDPLTYNWDLDNNGTYETPGQNVQNTWSIAGNYTVGVQADDGLGGYAQDTAVVSIGLTNNPPVANAGGPYQMYENQAEICFWAGDSYDPDPGDNIISYEWDLDNDGSFDGPPNPDPYWWESWWFIDVAYGMVHPADPVTGLPTNTITLRVTDSFGLQSTQSTTVTIYGDQGNYPPIAEANYYYGSTGTPVTLDATGSRSSAPIVSYEWDINLDGTYDYNTPDITTQHTWVNPGYYFIRLRITDSLGRTATDIGDASITGSPVNQNPTVDAGGPYGGIEGNSVSLTATGNDLDGDPLTYNWDLDNNGSYETPGQNISNTWSNAGNYTVGVQVDDGKGGLATDTAAVNIASSNQPPTVEALDQNTYTGCDVNLDIISYFDPDGDELVYRWDINDDGWDTDYQSYSNCLKTWNQLTTIYNWSYPASPSDPAVVNYAKVEVSDGHGHTATDIAAITVNYNQIPVISMQDTYTVYEGQAVFLRTDATDDGTITGYWWDLGYDGVGFDFDYIGRYLSRGYADEVVKHYATIVQDDRGAWSEVFPVTVNVINAAPQISSITDNAPVYPNQPVTVTVNASDAGFDPMTYSFDWDNDGNYDIDGQADNSAQHTYTSAGTKTIGIKVEDNEGGITKTTHNIEVTNTAPVADTGGPYTVNEGQSVTLDGSASSDPDEPYGDSITNYVWTIDGNPVGGNSAVVNSGVLPSGVHQVSLTVTDSYGLTNTADTTLTVNNVAPTANAGADRSIWVYTTLNFFGNSTDPGNDVVSYQWDLDGNGTFETVGQNASYRYDNPGTYTVTLKVTDDDGAQGTDTATVVVSNTRPATVTNPVSGPATTIGARKTKLNSLIKALRQGAKRKFLSKKRAHRFRKYLIRTRKYELLSIKSRYNPAMRRFIKDLRTLRNRKQMNRKFANRLIRMAKKLLFK
ncbi:MAG: PKD domain-containing protein [Actinobacteria bacterium]|nr:MAG: PKD domain-containing protein [Actinomycetota bacterium]